MTNRPEYKAFERELPTGYELAYRLDARKIKPAVYLSLASLLLTAVPLVISWLTVFAIFEKAFTEDGSGCAMACLAGFGNGMLAFLPITVVHELIHGWAYRKKTGEKPTFGISWSCAFCGVPNIYTYRRVAVFALLAPMVIISAFTLGGAILSLSLVPLFSVTSGAREVLFFIGGTLLSLFSFHFGGCVGDGYMAILFFTKYRDNETLVRDTGPEQFIYVPSREN